MLNCITLIILGKIEPWSTLPGRHSLTTLISWQCLTSEISLDKQVSQAGLAAIAVQCSLVLLPCLWCCCHAFGGFTLLTGLVYILWTSCDQTREGWPQLRRHMSTCSGSELSRVSMCIKVLCRRGMELVLHLKFSTELLKCTFVSRLSGSWGSLDNKTCIGLVLLMIHVAPNPSFMKSQISWFWYLKQLPLHLWLQRNQFIIIES